MSLTGILLDILGEQGLMIVISLDETFLIMINDEMISSINVSSTDTRPCILYHEHCTNVVSS
jgi:hypothetical protein